MLIIITSKYKYILVLSDKIYVCMCVRACVSVSVRTCIILLKITNYNFYFITWHLDNLSISIKINSHIFIISRRNFIHFLIHFYYCFVYTWSNSIIIFYLSQQSEWSQVKYNSKTSALTFIGKVEKLSMFRKYTLCMWVH